VLPQLIAAAEQRLRLVERLGADLADVVDPHQCAGLAGVGWRQLRRRQARGRRRAGGPRRREDRAQAGVQRAQATVAQAQAVEMGWACERLHSVGQCFNEEIVTSERRCG